MINIRYILPILIIFLGFNHINPLIKQIVVQTPDSLRDSLIVSNETLLNYVAGDSTHFCMADALGLLEEAYDTLYPRNVYVGNEVSLKMQLFKPNEIAIENTDCGLILTPNPAHTYVEIQITTENPEESELKICDINGRTIQVYKNLTGNLKIDLKDKKPGVYYLLLLNKSEVMCNRKLIIE